MHRPLRLGTEDTATVELVLAEALNNVVEHALANVPMQTTIEIRGEYSAAGLHLTVIDHGAPMPDGIAPVAKAPNIDVEMQNIPEGGFGWFLIHTLATEVRYTRIGTANHLSLNVPVGV